MTSTDRPSGRRPRWLRRLASAFIFGVSLFTVSGWFLDRASWGPFRGRLVDAETGGPIAGAHVVARWDRQLPTLTGDGGRSFFDAAEAVTDRDGYFELPGPSLWWRGFVLRPDFGFFAPGYTEGSAEVTPREGMYFIDPTIVRMRPLKTREERCRHPGIPLHDKAPLYKAAVEGYILGLDC